MARIGMKMKPRLMLLGGIRYLLPVIQKAQAMGVEVITADYLPDNIAHKYSDSYVNVSILDREAVLEKARELEIDGIMSFGVDPGVVTAAYVAEQMGLAYPPLASCEILQNKDKFRDFLEANGFNCPFHKGYESKDAALADAEGFPYPIIVKPVDSAGSKGVTRVDCATELAPALDVAFSETHNGHIIIEQFLQKIGSSSDTDSFSIDNELVFASFNCQIFDDASPNPYTPAAYTWPSDMPNEIQAELRNELQRLMKLLNLGSWIYNIETRQATDGKAYIMEVSPRGGGNRLSEMLEFASGQDLIANNIRAALKMPLVPMQDPVYTDYWVEYILHSNQAGTFKGITLRDDLKAALVQEDLWVKPGEHVQAFSGANQTIGTLVFKFKTREEAIEKIKSSTQWLQVNVV